MALADRFGRVVRKLRVSVTDRCNYRCSYCLPVDPVWLPRREILTFEEIERVVRLLVPEGVRKLRLTGGEPLLRRDVVDLVGRLARIDGLEGLAMTTNGFHLAHKARALREAGLRAVTVSLDTLDAKQFQEMVKRDAFDRVMAGLEACIAAGFPAVKVNTVVMRGINEDQVERFAELARSGPWVVRFIEFMPLDSGDMWDRSQVVPGEEVRRRIAGRWPLEAVETGGVDPARRYRFRDGAGEIGFISSVSSPFCESCDRIRMTADGKLLNCLFGHDDYDLRQILRGGGGDDDLLALVRRAVGNKDAGHLINRPGFVKPKRPMASIGG